VEVVYVVVCEENSSVSEVEVSGWRRIGIDIEVGDELSGGFGEDDIGSEMVDI
jgi:hypothetical protein